jgi:hypothetical protein
VLWRGRKQDGTTVKQCLQGYSSFFLATTFHDWKSSGIAQVVGLILRNVDGLRASKREHVIEDMDGHHDLGILTGIGLRTQLVTNDLPEAANRDLHPRSPVVAGALCQSIRPRSAMHVR